MMRNLDDIENILAEQREELRRKYKVAQIGIFGSYTRGEQRERSDIDILVEFERGHKTFDNYMELKFFLEGILHLKVDLVLKNAIREEIKENILSEATYV
jgi:predicted nucleotidyltransferase